MDRWLNKHHYSVHVECPICGQAFTVPPSRLKKYNNPPTCSKNCRHKLHSEIIKANHPRGMLGKKHTPETIAAMKVARSTPEYKDKIFTPERNKKISAAMSGPLNLNWNGGPKTSSAEKDRIRKSFEYRQWRTAVFSRDCWTCRECGDRSGRGHEVILEAHHIKSFNDYPELRFVTSNGITLCKPCHNKISAMAMLGNQNGRKVA